MKILRYTLLTLLLLTVSWILFKAVVPSGKITYIYDFSKDNRFISRLTPDARIEPKINNKQKIIGNPIYFNLDTPRKFNNANLTIKYKYDENKYPISLIEAGILADNILWRYNLKPIKNTIIDELALQWNILKQDDIILLQREQKYNNIDNFLKNIPISRSVALYNYALQKEFIAPNYLPSQEKIKITNALKGPYQFYTYLKNEDLYYKFTFVDVNENKDSDPIELLFTYGGQLIDKRELVDDGIANDNNKISKPRTIEFKLANLPEGVYKIELRTNDDIITKEIITKQTKFSFLNKIRLADDDNTNIDLYTDSKKIQVLTTNPAKLQTIKINDNKLDLNKTYKQFNYKTTNSLNNIILEHDDIILSGDGVFSFIEDGIINPAFQKVDENLNVDIHGVDYILAKYNIQEQKDEWKEAYVNFNLNNAFIKKGDFLKGFLGGGTYSFLLSIPELNAEDDIDDWIEISEIKFDLTGKSIIEFLNN